MSNLDNIIAQAKQASTALTPVTADLPAAPPPTPGQQVGFSMSLDSFLNAGGMQVASYVSVKDAGIRLNKDWSGYLDEFEATLDMRDVKFFIGIRKEVGKTVEYAKSYDGQSTVKGEPFAQVVAAFKAASQKPADPYRGADIPLVLAQDYADPKDKTKKYEAGTKVGLTTSITGFFPFADFAKKLQQAGLMQSVVKVKVTHKAMKNNQGQEYGICEFDVIEIVEDNRPQAVAA